MSNSADQVSETFSLDSTDSNRLSVDSDGQVNPLAIAESHRTESGRERERNLDTSMSRSKSGQSSVKTNRVPVKHRRGLLAQLVLIPEYEDARDYPNTIKYFIVFIIAFAAVTGPMGTSIMLPAIDDVCKDLNTQVSVVNISVGIYLLSLGIFPMWWSTFSETYGRRTIYLISFSMFFAFSIGAALSPNIVALIILRVLQGGCSASVQAVGAGTVSDLFIQQEMGRSMGIYYLGPLLAPFSAPIIGGVVGEVWGWRATQWVLVIVSGINVVSIMFLLPETLRKEDNLAAIREMLRNKIEADSVSSTDEHRCDEEQKFPENDIERIASYLSRRSSFIDENEALALDTVMPTLSRLTTNRSSYSRRITQGAFNDELKKTLSHISDNERGKEGDVDIQSKWKRIRTRSYNLIIRPTHSLILLRHPPVALVISYSAICFSVVYFFNMTIAYEYAKEPYNFKTIIVGLMYIPNSVTYIMSSIIGGRWNDKLLREYAKKNNGELVPEARISWNVVTAIVLFPPACLIFGWAIKYGEHWVIPLIGTAIFGFASMLVIGATVTYLVDTLPGKGATGVALNNLIRQILAAIATFIVEPLLRALGPGVLFSILMGIMTCASISLIILKKRGSYYREHYDLSKLYDKL